MVTTSLRVGSSAPRDDGALLNDLADALEGLKEARPTMHLGIVNASGQLYREITVHGPGQYRAVRDCFVRRGFRLRPGDAQLIAHFERVAGDLYEPCVGAWDDE